MEYLNKVLIYLKQELPDHNLGISILNDCIVFRIEENKPFNDQYDKLYDEVLNGINRLRNKELPLKFTVKTDVQSRDFTI